MKRPPHRSPRGVLRGIVVACLLVVPGLVSAGTFPDAGGDTSRTYLRAAIFYGAGMLSASGAYADFFRQQLGLYVPDYDGVLFEPERWVTDGSGVLFTAEWMGLPQWGLGAAVATHGRVIGAEPRAEGWDYGSVVGSVHLSERHGSMGYYALATFAPWPPAAESKAARISFGAGAGVSVVSVFIESNKWYRGSGEVTEPVVSQQTVRPGLLVLGMAEWHIRRSLLFGIGVLFRWSPDIEVGSGQLAMTTENGEPYTYRIPAHVINFSTLQIGARITGVW